MDFVKIGEVGNPPDKNGAGCVPYAYEIAKYAISNADWCAFLNAVGEKASALGLWHKDMETGVLGGIVDRGRSGKDSASPLRFAVKLGWEKKPVVYVNYLSLCRYCNWLQAGDTEQGAYDLSVVPPKRLVGAKYFLPTDDEWYKAAYWDCSIVRLFGWIGGRGGYWKYPTRTNGIPSQDEANFERGDQFSPLALQLVPTPSNPSNPSNSYFYFTDVDEYANHPSPWGAVQMGGNAWEFLENVRRNAKGEWENTLRGGSFGYTETGLSKANVDVTVYNGRCYVFGARLARCAEGWRPHRMPLCWWRMKVMARMRACARKLKELCK